MLVMKSFAFFFFNLVLFVCVGVLTQPLSLRITSCYVGQGDAIILQYGGFTMLIDTGPKLDVLACLQRKGVLQKIDVLVLTHNDQDHIGAAAEILQRYEVGEVWWNGSSDAESGSGNVSVQNLEAQLSSAGVVRVPLGTESILLPGLRVRLVWSEKMREKFSPGENESNKNAGSLGLYVETESFGFLSLGDLECSQELAVGSMGLLNRVDLLKISHHGSKTSSCSEFLEKIAPEAVIISVGRGNTYGHPDHSILQNLVNQRSLIYRTDRHGDVSFQIGARGAETTVLFSGQ